VESRLQWIVGPVHAAVRARGSRVYTQWPTPEPGRIPMGLHLALSRPEEELYSDPTATRAVVDWSWPAPRLRGPLAAVLIACGAALAAHGVFSGHALAAAPPTAHFEGWPGLAELLLGGLAGYGLAAGWEAALARPHVAEGAPLFGLGPKGPSVEPVAWRLGVPATSAALALAGPAALAALALAWGDLRPAPAAGLAVGAALYVQRITLPLRPGPHTRLLEALLRVPDFSRSLRWSLTSIFLPSEQRSSEPQLRVMAAALWTTILWISASVVWLQGLAWPAGPSVGAPEIAFGAGVFGLAVAVAFALVDAGVRLWHYAFLFGGRVERKRIKPSGAAVRTWARDCALTHHIPGVATLPWTWTRASPGTLLLQQGATDRTFHWIASGEARVLRRDEHGDVHQLATLRGGSGVGELAFLDAGPRGADVVISRAALVVSLDFEDFDAHVSEADRALFREVVLAGQAFARAEVFRGCPPAEKEAWLRGGEVRRYEAGETVITEGGEDRWMGLVVQGKLDVRRDDRTLATLEDGAVFGESAFLFEERRNATLVALDDTLLWSWSPEWLERVLARTPLRGELEALAAARSSA